MNKGELILSVTAVSGELSQAAITRLIPRQAYRYNVLEDLQNRKLLRSYTKDRVKSYRLTKKGKLHLLEENPERYGKFLAGSAQTNAYISELPKRLRLHRISEVFSMMLMNGVPVFRDEKPDLFSSPSPRPPSESEYPAFYLSKEVSQLGDLTNKIKGARFVGVLLTENRFLLFYNTGEALMRWHANSEQRAQTLLTQYLGRHLNLAGYACQESAAVILGANMSVAEKLLTSNGGYKRQYFCIDQTFDHLYFLPDTREGDILLQMLMYPVLSQEFNRSIQGYLPDTFPSEQIQYDAVDKYGRPVLIAWDFDMRRIQDFSLNLVRTGHLGTVYCFDFQAPVLMNYFGSLAEIKSIPFESTWRWVNESFS